MVVDRMVPILCAIGSATAFVTMQVFVKILSQSVSPQYVISLRSILLLALNSIFVFRSNQYQPYTSITQNNEQNVKHFRLNIKDKKYFILMMKRLFWNVTSINCFLTCLKYVHISIANALLNTTPVLTFFVEAYYYKKSVNPLSLCISVVSFVGVLLILNPASHLSNDEPFNWFLLLPLIAAISNCLNWIYLHEMKDQFKEIVVLEYAYYTQLITSNLVMLVFGTMNTSDDGDSFEVFNSASFYFQVLMMVVLAYITHYLRIMATFKSKPSEILVFSYIGMLYSIFIDIFYFNTNFQWTVILGILLTSSGLLSKIVMELFTKNSPQKNLN